MRIKFERWKKSKDDKIERKFQIYGLFLKKNSIKNNVIKSRRKTNQKIVLKLCKDGSEIEKEKRK